MVGISKTGHNCEVKCILDEDEEAHLPHEYGITRTSAGFIACREKLKNAIVVIGNALFSRDYDVQTGRIWHQACTYCRYSGWVCERC